MREQKTDVKSVILFNNVSRRVTVGRTTYSDLLLIDSIDSEILRGIVEKAQEVLIPVIVVIVLHYLAVQLKEDSI